MDGTIVGGTGYIVAAYAVVWGGMLLYGLSLVWRLRRAASSPVEEKQP